MSPRVIVLCDGTWHSIDQGETTNVLSLYRALQHVSSSTQKLHYVPGVGTRFLNQVRGGLFGHGLGKRLQEAYWALANLYTPGSQLFFFGFSRGAYMARSLIGMIRNAGLLKPEHLNDDMVRRVYALYQSDEDVDAQEAIQFRTAYSYSHDKHEIGVHFLGVWDTVGALGVPKQWDWFGFNRRYAFHDLKLSKIVQHAYHALAVDEKRASYEPALWVPKPTTHSEQQWFVGSHSDVGGGYQNKALASIALRWILEKAVAHELLIPDHFVDNIVGDYAGVLHDPTQHFPFRFLPKMIRSIGLNNDEAIHQSVYQRYQDPRCHYRPVNLEGH